VVVLQGCTQTAAATITVPNGRVLADRHNFALLYPEQQRSNNANLCFNWIATHVSAATASVGLAGEKGIKQVLALERVRRCGSIRN
jgi:poly(3-hydroxybutyrate) depolymerase